MRAIRVQVFLTCHTWSGTCTLCGLVWGRPLLRLWAMDILQHGGEGRGNRVAVCPSQGETGAPIFLAMPAQRSTPR